jgi:hypothetical protein
MNYDDNNKIAIFKNDKKGNEKAPDYRGTTTIENKKYKVALWKRKSKTGTDYISGTIELDTPQERVYEEPKTSYTPDELMENAYVDFGKDIVEEIDDEIGF